MQLKDDIGWCAFYVFETDEMYVGEFHTGPGWCTKLIS